MTRQKLPAFSRLVDIVTHTFTDPATFLPNNMEHWTYPDEESGPQLVIGSASALKAHAHLPLAASFTMGSSSELQLVTKMSGDHTAIVIILNEDLWSDAGHLEIVGYEAESYDGKLIYNNFASLTCQIFWSKSFTVRQVGKYEKGGTRLNKSVLLSSAQVFVNLLNLEI